jgi:hypothetical protein
MLFDGKFVKSVWLYFLAISATFHESNVNSLKPNSLLIIFKISVLTSKRSRVSSGSVVSDYGLDDRAIGVRFPAGAKDFSSSLCVQTCSGAYPASCTMGTVGPFPGGKARPRRDADHSTPSSAEVVNE